MLRYIFTFVLVLLMIETNAQSPFYYFYSQQISLTESNDMMLVTLANPSSQTDKNLLEAKIQADPDFYQYNSGYLGQYVLHREVGSSVAKSTAISNYLNEVYVASAAFTFDGQKDNNFSGVTNEVIVQAKSGVSSAQVSSLANQYGTLLSMSQDLDAVGAYHLFFDKNNNALDMANLMYQTGDFNFAEPNFFFMYTLDGYNQGQSHLDCLPILQTLDPKMQDRTLWGLYTGQQGNTNPNYFDVYGGSLWADINVCHGWDYTTPMGTHVYPSGGGTVVAVVDDGVFLDHPDLAGNLVTGYDMFPTGTGAALTGTGAPGSSDEFSHHGTKCAGIIGALRNNTNSGSNYGVVGVAYNTEIMPIRAAMFDPGPMGGAFHGGNAALANGIKTAYQQGADVISCSWSSSVLGLYLAYLDSHIQNAATQGRGGKGCVIVFSVGNENKSQINYPSSIPDVIAVGAMNMCNERKRSSSDPSKVASGVNTDPNGVSCDAVDAWGSNYGKGPGFGTTNYRTSNYLSVVAPGVHVYTTDFEKNYFVIPPVDVATFNPDFGGTSASAPYVAGVAALMLSVNPCLEAQEVKALIELSASKVGGYSYITTSGIENGVWNSEMGHGRLNAGSAVELSHDLYKQAKIETASTVKVYEAKHQIFAGEEVTDVLPYGYYNINSNSRITFYSPESIVLAPGVFVDNGALFFANITPNQCDNSHFHYKQPKEDNNTTVNNHYTPGVQQLQSLATSIKVYPNPAKDMLNIDFYLQEGSDVDIAIVNMLGQKVISVAKGELQAGYNKKQISIKQVPSGMYLVRIQTGQGLEQVKFVKQ